MSLQMKEKLKWNYCSLKGKASHGRQALLLDA